MLAIAEAKKAAAEEKWGKKEEVKYAGDGTFFDVDVLR